MTGQSINSNIANEINAIDARLAQLKVEREQLIQQKNALLNQPISESLASKFTPEQKVFLFQSLFRGRMDIFATRWQNSKGRSGYSVTCKNEWKKGICNKPRSKNPRSKNVVLISPYKGV